MKNLGRYTSMYLFVTVCCIAAITFLFQTVSSGVAQSEHRKHSFVSKKNSALTAIDEALFLQASYPDFQELIDSQKLSVRRTASVSENLIARRDKNAPYSNQTKYRTTYDSDNKTQRKVSWIKTLEAAKVELGIAEMSFEIYPYQSVANELQDLSIAIGFESIVLHVSLLHEGVLAGLLKYLHANAPNLFLTTSITMERLSDSIDAENAIQLTAEVTLKWHLIEIDEVGDEIES